jgi:hypothetical protein
VSTKPIACLSFCDRDRFTSPSAAGFAISLFISLGSLAVDIRGNIGCSSIGIGCCLMRLRLRDGRDPARSRVCDRATSSYCSNEAVEILDATRGIRVAWDRDTTSRGLCRSCKTRREEGSGVAVSEACCKW